MEIVPKKTEKPLTGSLLSIAQRPVYPFVMLRLEKTRKGATAPTILRLKVDDEVYEYLTKVFGTNELVIYLDPRNGKMEVWTPGMHLTFEAMEELGLMTPASEWLEGARPFLRETLSKAVTRMR